MNSGDNSDNMPAKASVEAPATEDPNPNRSAKGSTEESLADALCADGLTIGDRPSVISPQSEDGGERRTMQKRNMGKKLDEDKSATSKAEGQAVDYSSIQPETNTPIAARTKPARARSRKTEAKKGEFKDHSSEDSSINTIKSFYGNNVKSWLEAQEIHLKREEAQRAFSSTIETLCKDRELRESLKTLDKTPLAPSPLAFILKRCVDYNLLLGTRDLKKFEKELKRFGFDLGTTHLTLKGFMHFSAALQLPEIKQLLMSEEWHALPREVKFLELLLELYSHRLVKEDDNTGNLYSALPPDLKVTSGRFDGDLGELIKIRELLERDSVKKHLNGTRLAGQSPEDRFLSLLLNLVEKEGLNPETDYRLVYGALPLKRKGDLTDSHIKINYLTQLRKALERDSIKGKLKEWSKLSLSPEELFIEFVLALRAEKLVAPEMTEAQIFSSLPPKVRGEMKFVEMPYSDIANFRSFFSAQSVQARLHMLLGSDKTPWQKFEELNALLYDQTNESARSLMRGTLPEDYFELHSWLPPKLRIATSPIQDEEDLNPQLQESEDKLDVVPEISYSPPSEYFEEKLILKPSDPQISDESDTLPNSDVPLPDTTAKSIDEIEELKGEKTFNMDKQNLGSPEGNISSKIPPQSKVALSFAPRFGDHSIRQKTSLNLTSYRPQSLQSNNLGEEIGLGANNQSPMGNPSSDRASSNLSPQQQITKEVINHPVQILEVDSDDLKNLYRSGRTWGDIENADLNLDAETEDYNSEDTEAQNIADANTVIELGFDETQYPHDTANHLETSAESNLESVTPKIDVIDVQPNNGPNGGNPSIDIDSGDILTIKSDGTANSPESVSVLSSGTDLKEGFDPETSDSLSDHLAYTAASKITPEERLLEFAVFLNRNKLLATTKSFKELFEKLPTDIRPEFKMVDLDLSKFLEFRQDISRHFVKEHLRTTKEKGLEGEERFAEFIGFLKKNGLMPQLPDSAEVYKLIPISLKREFGNVLSNEPVNLELRKNLEMEVVKEFITTLEGSPLAPEDRLVELGIFLQRNGLLASIDNLVDLHSQLPFDMRRAFKRCDANLQAISTIRSVLEKEMIKEHLRNTKEANLNDEERFIELVIFLQRNELVNRGTCPSDIYMSLPSHMKGELKRCDFPSEVVIQVRDCLDKPPVQAQVELLKKMWFSHQEKFMELAVFMRQNGYMPANVDTSLLYCGLPANLKKELSIIDLPLDAVVQLRKNLEREFVKAHIKSSENDHLSPEERFVELVVFLYRNELMPDIPTLDDVYTALPADLRLEFSRTEIPLEQILLFRDILDKDSVRDHWNGSRSLGGSGEDRFADLVVFLKREGLLIFEDNLGYFYTALPVEFKRELSNFVFKVETITRLKGAIKAAETSVSF